MPKPSVRHPAINEKFNTVIHKRIKEGMEGETMDDWIKLA
jgi:hypothetical protein